MSMMQSVQSQGWDPLDFIFTEFSLPEPLALVSRGKEAAFENGVGTEFSGGTRDQAVHEPWDRYP